MAQWHPWKVVEARYAAGKVLVKPNPTPHGYKDRQHRLIEILGGRYTNRENGYIMSMAAVTKLGVLYDAGFSASLGVPPWTTSHLFDPKGERTTVREALRALKPNRKEEKRC